MKSGIPFPLVLVFVLPTILTACTAPLVSPKPPTFQSKATHVTDWRALAERMANRFAATHDRSTPVFVAPGPPDMPFAVAYRNQLEQALLRRGYDVVETSTEETIASGTDQILSTYSLATVLRFEVQTFLYRNSDAKPVPYATALAAAYAVGLQMRHVSSLDTGAAIAGGAGPIVDILASLYDTTKAEVVVNLNVYGGTHLKYRDSETFYVHPSEIGFYATGVPDFLPQAKGQMVTEVSLPVR